MRRPRWVLWVAGWMLAMAAIALGTDAWQEADWKLYEATSTQRAPPWPRDLLLIDVPGDPDVAVFRARLVQLAAVLAAQPAALPRAVVFDVQFTEDPRGLPELVQALNALRGANVKLYAAVNPFFPSSTVPWPDFMSKHARPIYEGVLDGLGHTAFDQYGRAVKYDPQLALGGGITLKSLVIKLAEEQYLLPPNTLRQPLLVQLGAPAQMRARAWRFEQGRFAALAEGGAPDFRQRIIIVGDLRDDRVPGAAASGPEHLAWALAARAASADVAEPRLLAHPFLLLGLTLLLAALAAAAAWWAGRRAARSARRLYWLCAAGLILPLLVLLGAAVALRAIGLVLGQVTLPALGVIAAVLMSALFAWRYRLWAAINAGAPSQEQAYDVFVSYSRSDPAHVQWVREHIVAPLGTMTHPEGRSLHIFFDTHEIKVGDNWFERLLNAVGSSRCFLPVYSADYHAKHFCRFELEAAVKRRIQGAMVIVPVRCGEAPVPQAAAGVQFVSAEAADFMTQVKARLDEAWRAELREAASADVLNRGRIGSDGAARRH